ncbi:MAG TPA: FdhF/YdeP family oxidoreductase [Streptosporangiaceae bacterium]|nr:FdhF/YdeP family oxidoreductase [Streptosporangiaceae bacterium]
MSKLLNPSLWVSAKPFGIGEQRPNNYRDIWNAAWDNRDQLRYAWRILKHGCCDGCSLGTTGMRDWTMDEIHLCNVRLRLLRLNTMPAFDHAILRDVGPLRQRRGAELRELGRLAYPMARRAGEPGFRRISWDEALNLAAERIRATTPDRIGFYLTSRGEPNENYYAAQKAARALGTNSVDNAARLCHSPSTAGLKRAVGAAATTCSYRDWIGSDLVVFIGSNVAANQPVAMKYLYHAKKAGTKVAVVNSYREPGMERYWVPSNTESALFGTKITDRFFLVNVGGDVAFLNGTLKHMIERDLVDRQFIGEHSAGFADVEQALAAQSWDELERLSGAARAEMEAFARMVGAARTAVFVWSMGITQHEFGADNVQAIINLGLSRGFVGRPGCGLMPIRGHSGVQGGAEMGAYSTVFPGGGPVNATNAEALSKLWGFEVPSSPGLIAPEMIDAAHQGNLDVLVSSGGNFLDVLPDPGYCREALGRIPLRVHMDIVLSSQMLVDPAETVLLLPAATRYEMPGGVTETSTERRVIFSPEIPGPRVGEARPEWEVFMEIAKRARPELAGLLHFDGTAAIRRDIARTIPAYAGIEHLAREGDQFQYGGPHLCWGWKFATPDGKAHFEPVTPPRVEVPEGSFLAATRRGKQFNSMVQGQRDGLTGADRDAVLISAADAARLGLANGDPVRVTNDLGTLSGRAYVAAVQPGTLQLHWPEAEVLIDRSRRAAAGVPDYNAVVRLEPARQPAPA